jgi:hypothetical protein
MQQYSLDLANSTAQLNCSCCQVGMTSVCGFIRRNDQPYSVYYALIHNTRKDLFVRLSISVGDWWKHDSYENRYALCLDVTPRAKGWRFSVLDPVYSPQQNLEKFGEWLGKNTDRKSALFLDLMEIADFIVAHDPALITYLTGRQPDYTGREVQRASEN